VRYKCYYMVERVKMEEIDQQSNVSSGRFFSCHHYMEYQAVLLVIWYAVLFRQNRTDRPVLKKDIREDLIVRHWDDMNRLAALLKDGLVRPSLVVSKLQAMQRQNPLQQAIQELGRIGKTGHILHYVDDPPFRRRVLVGLNKGESLHSLARDISVGHQGRFTDRSYEAQLNRASALSLVINAIVVWNTRHFERAQAKLLEQGVQVDESAWQPLSPLAWKHINLVGSYHFSDVHLQGEFRPLCEVEPRRKLRGAEKRLVEESVEAEDGRSQEEDEYPEQSLVQLPLLRDVSRDEENGL
jgi:Tn3 transposase DDE domain